MAERIVLFNGSGRDFETLLETEIDKTEQTVDFLELIRTYNAKIRASDLLTPDFDPTINDTVDNCIVRADDFGSVLSHVIQNFSMIISQSYDIRTLYIQNPPKSVSSSLETLYPEVIERRYSEYPKVTKNALCKVYRTLVESILGQEHCKEELVCSLYQLSAMQETKPIVLLFYGPSGVGKTETAKCLSEILGGKLTRIQFSMMQTQEAYNYIFGAEHSKGSFARDLLARESNIILLDEFDKANAGFYNAFYELFDEGTFTDTNYQVDLKNAVFICTSNFDSKENINEILGPAMFSRIGSCVQFTDLSVADKVTIIEKHFAKILDYLDDDDRVSIAKSNILPWFIQKAPRYKNIRTMKIKIEKAVFKTLSKPIFDSYNFEN